MTFCGNNWNPSKVERIVKVLPTSTRPLIVVTDDGNGLLKYIGNQAGNDALICELVGTELANWFGLTTPDFAIINLPKLDAGELGVPTKEGPAFCSRWTPDAMTMSPDSNMISKLRNKDDISKLVVFDTWIRNLDRYSEYHDTRNPASNMDNLIFSQDKRMTKMLVIDHTHAFVEGTLDDDLDDDDLLTEKTVYGLFPQFRQFLSRKVVQTSLEALANIDTDTLMEILDSVPREWGFSANTKDKLVRCLEYRAREMSGWLPAGLFDQAEMNFNQ